MSEALTDAHHDWVSDTLSVDPRTYSAEEPSPAASADTPAATAAAPPAEAAPAPEEPPSAATAAAAPAPEEPTSGGFFDSVANLARGAVAAVGDAASAVKDAVVDTAHAVADTAVAVEHAVVDAVVSAEHAVEKTVGEVVQAVKTAVTGEAPLPPDVPKARADAKMKALPPEDQAKVQALLDGAKSDKEKQYLTKGLAAGHTPAELEEFAKKINGKDDTWLNDHLRLVGDSKGKGIEQQWSYSCGPTTVEAIKGELDPLYAMKVREENPNFESADDADGLKMNPKMAQDQKDMLKGGKGVATSRNDPDKEGSGLVFKTLLNKQTDSTGLVYDSKVLGKDTTVDDALNTMQDGVSKGVPVPITVGDAKQPYAHAALVTAVDKGPPRTFTIHDPYYGKTDTFTEDQIKNDQVNVGGWKHVGVVFPPSIKQ